MDYRYHRKMALKQLIDASKDAELERMLPYRDKNKWFCIKCWYKNSSSGYDYNYGQSVPGTHCIKCGEAKISLTDIEKKYYFENNDNDMTSEIICINKGFRILSIHCYIR